MEKQSPACRSLDARLNAQPEVEASFDPAFDPSTSPCGLAVLDFYSNVADPSLVLVIDPSPCPDVGSYVTSPTCVHAKNPRRLGAEGNKLVCGGKILDVEEKV